MEHLAGFQWPLHLDILVYFGLLFILSQAAGRIANWLGAPRITGYLLAGILFGPHGLNIFSTALISERLGLITDIALAVIAFSIGGALQIKVLRGLKKNIAWITVLQASGAFVVVFILAIVTLPIVVPRANFPVFENIYLTTALILATLSVATAPAAILSLVHELKAKGRFTTVLLGVVALDDAVTIVIYGYVIVWVRALMGGELSGWSNALIGPVISTTISAVIGLLIGILLIRIIKYCGHKDVLLGFVFGAILLTGGLTKSFGVSPLFGTMVLGFIIENFSRHDRASEAHDVIENIEEPLIGIFFSLAGAHLRLDIGFISLGIALVVMGGRFLGKLLGSGFGAGISGSDRSIRKYLGVALLPSAGVAIGLALDAKDLIDTISPYLGSLVVSVVVTKTLLNEIISPFLVRWALIKAGETDVEKAHFRIPVTLHGRKGRMIGHRGRKTLTRL